MNVKANLLTEIVFRSLVSFLCCVVIGYVFYQSRIFNRHPGVFSIPAYGLIGSVFFYSLRINIKNAFAVLFVLVVMNAVLVPQPTSPVYLLRDFFCFGGLSGAIIIFTKYFYTVSDNKRWIEPLILSALTAAFMLVAMILVSIMILGLSIVTLPWMYNISKLYYMTGLGIGIGIILTEKPYSDKIHMCFLSFFNN